MTQEKMPWLEMMQSTEYRNLLRNVYQTDPEFDEFFARCGWTRQEVEIARQTEIDQLLAAEKARAKAKRLAKKR